MSRITVHHIPVCPFSQRLEILLGLKGRRSEVDFRVVDVTRPRPAELLALTGGSTQLPVLETADGRVLKESLVILQYLEDLFPEPAVAQRDPYRRAVESMMTRMEGEFAQVGYQFVMNQAPERREALRDALLRQYALLNDFLLAHAPDGLWLFDRFGWAETVFAPLFMRFWFVDYYEAFALPAGPAYARVRAWQDACRSHPAAGQVTREQIVKLYHDYALGYGNGAVPTGRRRSSFSFEPEWSARPWPPRDKFGPRASDAELGL